MPIRSGDIVDGRYRIGGMLGRGGMGIVFEAHHIELDQPRAIKVMQPTSDDMDSNAAVRFKREARAAASLKGQHVARIYDIGILETGERYIVMERLSGIDLRTLVARAGALPAADAVRYLEQACTALAEAHDRGILHRDVKSSNLFLDEEDRIKVIDWGLAKQTMSDETSITAANCILGSLDYMSPEQINGGPLDVRSDIWSLGVVLYELVTGRLPFTGARCQEVIHRILNKEIPSPGELSPDVPLAVGEIVARCLEKNPERRYGAVRELAQALRAALGAFTAQPTYPPARHPATPAPSLSAAPHLQTRECASSTEQFRPPTAESRASHVDSCDAGSEAPPPTRRLGKPASRRGTTRVHVVSTVVLLFLLSPIATDPIAPELLAQLPGLASQPDEPGLEPGPSDPGDMTPELLCDDGRGAGKPSALPAPPGDSDAPRSDQGTRVVPSAPEAIPMKPRARGSAPPQARRPPAATRSRESPKTANPEAASMGRPPPSSDPQPDPAAAAEPDRQTSTTSPTAEDLHDIITGDAMSSRVAR